MRTHRGHVADDVLPEAVAGDPAPVTPATSHPASGAGPAADGSRLAPNARVAPSRPQPRQSRNARSAPPRWISSSPRTTSSTRS